mmetsp:Transcript_10103/g.23588  ORF Transcript_10103/g.23588 Transcript_10103/m.23588 type:complete len:1058 (-) Transcript_10103:146-3319(-)
MANRTANYEGIDDPGALKAILRAKDSALSTVEQRLAMQRDALANMKESGKQRAMQPTSSSSGPSNQERELERELLVTKGKLSSSERQVEDLQNRLRNFQDSTSSVPYLEERVKTLTESLDMKDATIAEMRRLHGQGIDSGQSELLQKDLASVRNQIDGFNQERNRLNREVERLNKDLYERSQQIKQVRDERDEQVKQLQMDASKSRQLLAAMETKLSDMTRGMDALRVERDFLLSQDGKDQMQERIGTLEHELQEERAAHEGTSMRAMQVTEEAGQLRAALELASERENQNVDALDGATAKEEHMQKIVSNLRSDLDVHRAKLAEMHNVSAQLQRAQGQLAESGTKLARQAQEMETLDRELEAAKGEIEGLNRSLDASGDRLNETLVKLQATQEKVEALQRELADKDQQLNTANGQLANMRQALDTRSGEFERAAAAHQDSAEGVRALQDRLNVVSGQLHQRNQEHTSLKQDMKAAEEELQRFRQERERTHGSLQSLGQEKQSLDKNLAETRESNNRLNAGLSQAKKELDDFKAQSQKQLDDLRGQHKETQEQLQAQRKATEDERKKAEGLQQRIYDLDEALETMSRQLESKDQSLNNLVATRSSLTQNAASLEAEVDAVKEDRETVRVQLEETANQLQVSHSRILTLEGRVRELVAASGEIEVLKERLAGRELELEDMTMRAKELEDEAGRASILATYLKEKDNSVNETMRRNNNLLADKELLQRENEHLRSEVQQLQGEVQQLTIDAQDLRRELASSSEAAQFSEKMLVVSREQTDSLEALRKRLKSQEELVEDKERELEDFKQQARLENQDLRDRLLSLTDNNRTLQAQCLAVQSQDKGTTQQLRTQVEELRDQLLSAVDQSQSHFIAANQMRGRVQHIKSMVVKRMIGQWAYSSASAAFGAWVGALEQVHMDKQARQMQQTRQAAPPPQPLQSSPYDDSPYSRFSQRQPEPLYTANSSFADASALPPRMNYPASSAAIPEYNPQRSLSYKAPLPASTPVQPGYGQTTPGQYRPSVTSDIPGLAAPPGYQPPPSWSQSSYGQDPNSPDAPEIIL